MKLLIVHDRAEVSQQIKVVVESDVETAWDIEIAEDYYSARDKLAHAIYDFLIVDLTIPFIKDGGATPSFVPVDQLLKELFTLGTLNIPGDVIGMTRDPTAVGLVNASLGPHLMVVIAEDDDGNWKKYLRDKIAYARRAAETRSISVNRYHLADALVITAMDKEMKPFSELFELAEVKHVPGVREFTFNDKRGEVRKGIAYAIGRSGQASAASFTQSLVTAFRPKVALMTGYCGGVQGKVKGGDLIFFEAAYAWDYGKWSEEGSDKKPVFLSRPNPIDIVDTQAHRIARELVASNFCRMPTFVDKAAQLSAGKIQSVEPYLVPAASGSAVVANDTIVAQIRGLNDSIRAVDMECYGFYHAARHTHVVRPEFLCVKAVSDFCNGEKGDDLHDACSFISATTAVEILTRHWQY